MRTSITRYGCLLIVALIALPSEAQTESPADQVVDLGFGLPSKPLNDLLKKIDDLI